MNLKEIMAIAGKPGLYKLIAQAKNGIVVESIIDQKRLQAFTHDKVSTLEEISIYTESGDKPLKELLQVMYEKLEGKPAPENKGDNNKIKQFFGEILPDYDKERVYISHMQKIISWYNILLDHNIIDLLKEEEKENSEEPDVSTDSIAESEGEAASITETKIPSGKKQKEKE